MKDELIVSINKKKYIKVAIPFSSNDDQNEIHRKLTSVDGIFIKANLIRDAGRFSSGMGEFEYLIPFNKLDKYRKFVND